jgi:hypothetical protein
MSLEEEIRQRVSQAAERMPSQERWMEVVVASSGEGPNSTYGTVMEALSALLWMQQALADSLIEVARAVDALRDET